jgi:competence protein ComEC
MVTGTVHLLSISGSHLGLVSTVVYWAVKRTLLLLPTTILLTITRKITPSRLAILFTWPAVALYALLAGAELATMRSLTMITLAMVGVWLGHDRHLGHAMAAALLAIVLHDPHALFDISFQLSFLSVLVMITMISITRTWGDVHAGPDRDLKHRVLLSGLKALSIGAALTLTTLPLVAFYFNQVPWIGVIANLVAIPFTGLILVPFGLLVAVWSILTRADSLAVGSGLEHAFGWLIKGVEWCAGIPGVEWPVAAPSIPTMALFYSGLLLASLHLVSRPQRIAGAGIALAVISWWLIIPGPRGDGDSWRVTFLDVGQGDSAAVELPDGQTVLIDGGARYDRFDMGRSVVAPFLWNRGIHHIDHVIGTHQQVDHVGGLIWILRHMSVGQFWDQGVERPEKFVEELRAALRLRGIPERSAVRGQDVLNTGPCHLHVLNPQAETALRDPVQSLTGTVLNNRSIVLRFECGPHSILFSADIETDGLRQLPENGRKSVTVLKVPHHGARGSLDQEWLRQVHPQYAVVSVGATNPYGHPAESVLKTYEQQDITVYRTDLDGAVWVTGRLSTAEFTVNRMRDLIIQPVDLFSCPWRCEYQNWRRLFLRLN